ADRAGWHDKDHVFPLGFKSMRTIDHKEFLFVIVDPGADSPMRTIDDKEFLFVIVDPGADSPPSFSVQEVSSEKSRTTADSTNAAWTQI
ncbi:MAG: hypothetical protein AAFU77_18315, partial [Myxococcota bacterium]